MADKSEGVKGFTPGELMVFMSPTKPKPPYTAGRPQHGDIWFTTKLEKVLCLDPKRSVYAIVGYAQLSHADYDRVINPNDYDEFGDPKWDWKYLATPSLHSIIRRLAEDWEYVVGWA